MLVLVDGSSVLYRAYYAIRGLSTRAGVPTNAVYGFIAIVTKALRDFHPARAAVAFDVSKKTFRTDLYPDYKAHRPPMPEDLVPQIPKIKEYLDLRGIPRLELADYEADDVLATLARRFSREEPVVVLSGDKDLIPLVSDAVSVYQPSHELLLTPARVREKFGIEPAQMADILSIMGDSSDNVPGVKGIGEKGAYKLVTDWGSLENIYAHLGEVKPDSLRRKLEASREVAFLSRKLVQLVDDLPLEPILPLLPDGPASPALQEWLRNMEFFSLLKEESARPDVHSEREPSPLPALIDAGDRLLFLDKGEIREMAPGDLGSLPADRPIIVHGAKGLYRRLLDAGKPEALKFKDTELAAWLLDPGRGDYPLDYVGAATLGQSVSGNPAEQARALPHLWAALEERLEATGQRSVLEEIEEPLTPVLASMEAAGVFIDPTVLNALSREAGTEMLHIQERAHEVVGHGVNLQSPKQLREVLYGELKLVPSGKKTTKTKEHSTGEDALRALASQGHELPGLILRFRELAKLKGTYLDPLPTLADAAGRLHTTFRQTGTATGRLSSANPNLQNIPIRTEMGAEVRKAFAAPPGRLLVAGDYSQIELRLLAHFSGDPELKAAFEQGHDIHTRTAASIYQVPQAEVTPRQRRSAKTINFGIIYGMSAFGLSEALEITVGEAKIFMEAYFRQFPKVKAYLDGVLAEARGTLRVSTLFGRVRPVPELKAKDFSVRANAERMAINAPLQGTAADIIKKAMIVLHREGRGQFPDCPLVLQVHDELLAEAPGERAPAVADWMARAMEGVIQLSVPLTASVVAAANWYDAK
jgi:DNA polymerase-1